MDGFITMDHGSGGVKTSELIDSLLRPAFCNPTRDALGDGALLRHPGGKLAFSTDSNPAPVILKRPISPVEPKRFL